MSLTAWCADQGTSNILSRLLIPYLSKSKKVTVFMRTYKGLRVSSENYYKLSLISDYYKSYL